MVNKFLVFNLQLKAEAMGMRYYADNKNVENKEWKQIQFEVNFHY